MSDRIAVMSDGVIEQLDTPAEIYDRPRTAFVADFIGEMNFLDGTVTEATGSEYALETGNGVVVRGLGEATKGRKVRIGIRPARLSIAARAEDAGVNSARAVVDTKLYLGDEIQVVATLEGGTQMVIREQRSGADAPRDAIHPGDRITIQWDRSAPVLLAETPTHDTEHDPQQDNDRGDP
jgi:ABC-type Fe3+/spermidine/putrescine transport system ATPase subunit